LTIVPVITPRNGQAVGRSQFLHDLAAYCDGQVFDAQGTTLSEATPFMLGTIDSIKVGRSEGVILGKPVLERVETRIAELKAQMADSNTSEFDREMIRYRIGRMTGGVATIYAGGASALEAKERHARVVDAISAVRSAIMQGVVPGGGTTLACISRSLADVGVESILRRAITAPFKKILDNVGLSESDSETFGQKIGQSDSGFMVYDALSQKLVNWWDAGILDPAKVTLSALENALSVAQLLMTLGGVIGTEFTEDEQRIKMMQDGILKRVEEEAFE
jgi:chaperonin GroEL